MNHQCEAALVVCIDFRFQKFIRQFTDERLAGKTFDLIALAGSTKNLKTVLKQIEISVSLHGIKELYLIHHEDCGAYGDEGTLEKQTEDFKKAREIILKKFPELQVKTFYLRLNGSFEKNFC